MKIYSAAIFFLSLIGNVKGGESYNSFDFILLNCLQKAFNFQECSATKGEDIIDEPCVFPFKYQNNNFETCTFAGRFYSWCATKLNEDGYLLDKNWGYCNEDCPESGNPRFNVTDDLRQGEDVQ